MARNNLPKTTRVTVAGLELTINQNGRVIHGVRSPGMAENLIKAGHITRENGMLFVSLETLAKAFGLVSP